MSLWDKLDERVVLWENLGVIVNKSEDKNTILQFANNFLFDAIMEQTSG